jgi:EAL domain-containing protein (putative c-di-GMP-specific phosphodiesterase class I)
MRPASRRCGDSLRAAAQPGRHGGSRAALARRPARPEPAGCDDPERIHTTALWEAIANDRVVVHYQPQVDLRSGRVVGAEALVRIRAPNGRLLPPDLFIGRAEFSGLIVPIGRAVLRHTCADLARIRAAGAALPRLSVNLSAQQLVVDAGLYEYVSRTLVCHGLQPADLEFEIVERQSLLGADEAMTVLRRLAEAGSRLAIDDFGTGHATLRYLALVPVGAVKLDRCLVDGLPGAGPEAALVHGLINLAADLGLELVAEGVENAAQHRWLAAVGCSTAQGYLYDRPLDADALLLRLRGDTAEA